MTLYPSAKPRENNVPQPPQWKSDEEEEVDHENFDEIEEEEDPYNICPEDIYDTVDENNTYNPAILNRPPAPMPRPENKAEPEKSMTYISRGIVQSVFMYFIYLTDFIFYKSKSI